MGKSADIARAAKERVRRPGGRKPSLGGGGRHLRTRRAAGGAAPPGGPTWRRWTLFGIGAACVIAVGPASAMGLAPSSQTTTEAAAAQDPASALLSRAIHDLSAGAPPQAMTLGVAPAHTAQAPPASAAISGLAANGIPNVALNAYRVAAARMGSAEPSCGIDWSLLAGIGRVESNHGRFGGATLNADGTSTPRILGPALNGVHFAYIRDTDNGLYDGDRTTDRAVGPMQFIPSTWRSYAVDGNGDGIEDPFNINDAALAAAHYLCVAGGNLRTAAGQRQAVLAYNHSDSYVAEVLALAHAYANGIPVADLPMSGITTGAIPPPSGTFAYAPAAPGPAIGAPDRTTSRTATTYPRGVQPAGSPPATSGSGGTSGGSSSGGSGSGTSGSGTSAGGDQGSSGGSGGGSVPSGQPAPPPAAGGPGGSGSGSGSGSGGGVLPPPVTLPPPPVTLAPPPVTLPPPPPPPSPVPTLGLNPITGLKCYIGTVVAPGLLPCPPGTPPL